MRGCVLMRPPARRVTGPGARWSASLRPRRVAPCSVPPAELRSYRVLPGAEGTECPGLNIRERPAGGQCLHLARLTQDPACSRRPTTGVPATARRPRRMTSGVAATDALGRTLMRPPPRLARRSRSGLRGEGAVKRCVNAAPPLHGTCRPAWLVHPSSAGAQHAAHGPERVRGSSRGHACATRTHETVAAQLLLAASCPAPQRSAPQGPAPHRSRRCRAAAATRHGTSQARAAGGRAPTPWRDVLSRAQRPYAGWRRQLPAGGPFRFGETRGLPGPHARKPGTSTVGRVRAASPASARSCAQAQGRYTRTAVEPRATWAGRCARGSSLAATRMGTPGACADLRAGD